MTSAKAIPTVGVRPSGDNGSSCRVAGEIQTNTIGGIPSPSVRAPTCRLERCSQPMHAFHPASNRRSPLLRWWSQPGRAVSSARGAPQTLPDLRGWLTFEGRGHHIGRPSQLGQIDARIKASLIKKSTRSSVATSAPAANGHPPNPPADASNVRTPAARPAPTHEPCRGCHGDARRWRQVAGCRARRKNGVDRGRHRGTNRVRDGDLIATHCKQTLHHTVHLTRINRPVVRQSAHETYPRTCKAAWPR